jgi:sortase (surface protein transpeptidase)
MLRLISTLLILGWTGTLMTGCAGEYSPYEEVSASENQTAAGDVAAGDAADVEMAAGDATAGAAPDAPVAETGAEAAVPVPADAASLASDVPAQAAPAEQPLGQTWPPDSSNAQPAESSEVEPSLDQSQVAYAADPLAARLANSGGPVNIEIPAIGVSAPIENVGQTAEGAMDAPQGWMNVGWYDKGFQPGEAGNAVIAGHLDNNAGGPAVFWNLGELMIGDEVTVTYANGDRYTFIVEDWKMYDHDADGPTIDSIFGVSQTADLNLVTCDGAWDHGAATYEKRLVVFTTLEPEKTVLAGGGEVME